MNFTDEQSAAIESTGRSVCVDAGAGSGKTRVLIQHIVRLLDEGAELDEIAAITFTKKATAEMRDRLRSEFRKQAAQSAHDPAAQTRWRERERLIDTARVYTIDAFCSGLLRTNALSIGMDPDFTVLTDAEAAELRADTAERAYAELVKAEHEGATLLARRYGAWRIVNELRDILADADKWRKIVAEYENKSPNDIAKINAQKAEMLYNQILTRFPNTIEAKQLVALMKRYEGRCNDESDIRERFCSSSITAMHNAAQQTPDPAQLKNQLQPFVDWGFRGAKKDNWLLDDDEYKQLADDQNKVKKTIKKRLSPEAPSLETEQRAAETLRAGLDVIAETLNAYDREKRARNALDFGDLLESTVAMLREHPDIHARAQRGLSHILIDEFQDTNPGQWQLANLLSENGKARLFIVGDAKQSIYRFRGADVHAFQDAQKQIGATLPLRTNFRSTQAVLGFINDFFEDTGLLAGVEPEFHRLRHHRDDGDQSCIELLSVVEDPRNPPKAQDAIALEATAAAHHIQNLLFGPDHPGITDPESGDLRPIEPRDIAVLFRTSQPINDYEYALREAGIPYQIIEGSQYYHAQEITDLRNLIAVTLNPCDELSLLAFLRSPLAALSDDTLCRMARAGGVINIFDSKESPLTDPAERQRLDAARILLAELRNHLEIHPADWLRHALRITNFEAILLALPHGRQRAANVRKLIEQAESFTGTAGAPRLRGFQRQLDRFVESPPREAEAPIESNNAVTLMTIHKSKGLEYPVIYLANLSHAPGRGGFSSPIFPMLSGIGATAKSANFDEENNKKKEKTQLHSAFEAIEDIENQDEEARILYVAMTRARDRLVLCATPRNQPGPVFRTLESFFDLDTANDGDKKDGAEWACRITRKTPGASPPPKSSLTPRDTSVVPETALQPLTAEQPPTRLSVSALLNIDDEPTRTSIDQPATSHTTEALAFGNAVHRLFELWDYNSDPAPPIERVIRESQPPGDKADDWRTRMHEITNRFAKHDLAETLRADKNLHHEIPFVLRRNGVLIEGVIDVFSSDGLIVDYKTGAPNPQKSERYAQQLNIYAHAARELLGIAPPRACLYYVEHGITEEIEIDPGIASFLDAQLAKHQAPPNA